MRGMWDDARRPAGHGDSGRPCSVTRRRRPGRYAPGRLQTPCAQAEPAISLHQALGHDVPVGAVEEVLLHVVEAARPWRMGWVLIVEDELRRLAAACLEEAHHLAVVRGMLRVRI